MRPSGSRRTASLAVAGLGLVTVLAGCGGGDGDAATSGAGAPAPVTIEGLGTIEVDATLRDLVPGDIRDEGVVQVATNAPFAPYEMFASENDQTLVGLEPDLGHAVGGLLGLDFQFSQQPFDGLIPGVQAGQYDAVMATLFDTEEREQVVDMVNYSASGSGILVAAGNPEGIATAADLCGKSVAVQTGSAQVDIVNGFSADCEGAGKPAVELLTFPAYSDELLALSTGQATAVVGDIPAMSYSLTEKANEGRFELVIDPAQPNGYESAPVGIAVGKGTGLTKAVEGAVRRLMEDGTYTKLLDKWGVPQIAIDEVSVNAAGS